YVSDASTVLLMENFYRNLKKRDKGFSLCEAQRYMIQKTDYSLPFFWAPFVLFGDWK
ncbi:MAG: CHAT domain-containing protein, partial [Candidatus Cloacimonadota bacterium]